jgi:hypothetical protein
MFRILKIRSRKILCILQCRRDLTLGQQDGTTVHAARAAGKMVFINYVLRKKLVQIIKQKWNDPPLRELIFNVNEVFFVLEKQNF